MGAGKTTIGTQLATALGRPYIDNDVELRVQTGATATDLARDGEVALHSAEARYVESLLAKPDSFVASLPASIAGRPDLARAVNEDGVVIYICATPETLAARVATDPARPWLATDARATLEAMFTARHQVFVDFADIVVNTDGQTPDDIVRELGADIRTT